MKLKRILYSLIMAIVWGNAMAQQPFGGCWHPDNIINWSPENDIDAKFNRSTIALQPRINQGIKANKYQFPDAQVSACITMNPMCSQTPSQGADNFIGYNPISWQYMDILIWWGGSAGEGIIIPPSAPVTDIAHLNGVKVLGQLFFPPVDFGGQSEWVVQMLTKEGNEYPYAKKMYEIAEYYGFDGWFINEETGGGSFSDWVGWIDYFNKCAEKGGHPEMSIQWYDNGRGIEGKEDLMKLRNTSYFLDYGCTMVQGNVEKQMSNIQNLGFTKKEAFEKVFFGINVASGGLNGNKFNWDRLFGLKGQYGSIDLFNPEEAIWKKTVEFLLNTEDACGTRAYNAMKTVFENESRFWTNAENDPSNTVGITSGYWPGFANTIQERSTIQNLPFVTSFSAGLGKHRFVNGEKRGTQDWYHRGMQDILPTWRWWVDVAKENKKDVKFEFNWDDAYNMGTSVRVTSNQLKSGVNYLTRLFKTNLKISNGDTFKLIVKGDTPSIELNLGLAENDNNMTKIALKNAGTNNGWTILSADLSEVANKTVSVIALNLKGENKSCDFLMGELAILPANYSTETLTISNLKCQNQLKMETGDLRLVWDAPESEDLHHFNVYLTRNGERKLVGQTRNEAFYCSKFTRKQDEKSVSAEVIPVTKDMKEGIGLKIKANFPSLQKPNVKLTASKTLVTTNNNVVITAFADNYPETYKWEIPAGATKVSENGNKLTLKFPKEGLYDITVKVSNKIGETQKTIKELITVSNSKAEKLANISKGKSIHSVNGDLPPEVAENIIDGVEVPANVRDKWCFGGKKQHWVIIDLEDTYQIYRFKIFDCGNKESASDNIKNYKIWISDDAKTWEEPVVDATNRPESTKEDYIKPTVGRYVKFMPYDEEKPITIRVWEFQVFGLEGGPSFKLDSEVSLVPNEKKEMSFVYNLNGKAEESNFNISVTSENQNIVTVSNVKIDKVQSKVSYNLNALSANGTTEIVVKLTNGEWVTTQIMKVEVIDNSFEDVLSGKVATINELQYQEWGTQSSGELTDNNFETGYETYGDGKECVRITFDCGKAYDFAKAVITFTKNSTYVLPYAIRCAVSDTNKDDAFVEVSKTEQKAEEISLQLKEAKGRYIRFYLSLGEFEDCFIKEIKALGKEIQSSGIVEKENTTTIYPTVCQESFVVSGAEGQNLVVSNISGMQVYTTSINAQETIISTANWTPGLYFVKVGNQVTKIIRK